MTPSPASIRPPAVAGSFYPADPATLQRTVDGLLESPAAALQQPPKALVVPHAGYVYSGSTAGRGYAALAPWATRIHRVVLLGPTHRVAVRGLALPEAAAFATPLGNVRIDTAWTLKCYVDSESPSTVPLKEKTFSIGLVSPIEFLYSYSKVMPHVLQFGIEAEVKDEFANIDSEMQEKDKKERKMIIDIIKSLKSEKIKINKNNKENVVTCRVTPDPLSGEGVDISIEFYKTGKIIICAPRVMDTSYLMIESNETTYKGTIEAYKKIIARNKLITDAYYLPGGCNDIINAILSNIDGIRVEIRAKSKAITSQKMKVRNMSKKIVKESASNAINNEFSEEDFIKLFNGSDVVIKTDLCVTKYNVSSGNIEKANSYIVNKSLSSK